MFPEIKLKYVDYTKNCAIGWACSDIRLNYISGFKNNFKLRENYLITFFFSLPINIVLKIHLRETII